jgi:oligopeptide transport system permease protein
MDSNQFAFIDKSVREIPEKMRPSLTYWQDAWRRLKNHTMAMVGLGGVILIVMVAVFGPMMVSGSYSDQNLDYANVPPRLSIYQLDEDFFVYLTKDYKRLVVSEKGALLGRMEKTKTDPIKKH